MLRVVYGSYDAVPKIEEVVARFFFHPPSIWSSGKKQLLPRFAWHLRSKENSFAKTFHEPVIHSCLFIPLYLCVPTTMSLLWRQMKLVSHNETMQSWEKNDDARKLCNTHKLNHDMRMKRAETTQLETNQPNFVSITALINRRKKRSLWKK